MGNGTSPPWSKILDVTARLAIPIVLACAAAVITHEVQMSELRLRVARLESREIPPEWFERKVDKLESRVDSVLANQQTILQRLAVLEGR